ncbi:MAG: hypothetical protein AAGK37_12370 [Pseudomonadota bacterium]
MTSRGPLAFSSLTLAIALPFWGLGAFVKQPILPGLPPSALMVLAPAAAASVLVARSGGRRAVFGLLKQAFDWRSMTSWSWLVAFGTMPAAMLLSAIWLEASGVDLPLPQIGIGEFVILFALFIIAATAEEIGWTGYAVRPLVDAFGLLAAGATLGGFAVFWHIVPLLQAGRSSDWIAWWAVGTFARRIVILWLFIHGGHSVFSTSLFHAMSNVSWMMFPVMGSHCDPISTAAILFCLAAGLVVHDTLCVVRRNSNGTKDREAEV